MKEKLMKNMDLENGYQTGFRTFEPPRECTESASENCQRIERTIRYMMQHLNRSLQASDLAAVANLSLSHYFALFKRITGCSPIDFFIQLRMKRACHLLKTTSLNVKEIANELGYEDSFYFSRLFKSVNELAPTDYRKAHQEIIDVNKAHTSTESLRTPVSNTIRHNRGGYPGIVHPASAAV